MTVSDNGQRTGCKRSLRVWTVESSFQDMAHDDRDRHDQQLSPRIFSYSVIASQGTINRDLRYMIYT